MQIFCVACSFDTETEFMVCWECSELNGVPECFVPDLCQDDLCYVLPNGEVNLDGNCDHAAAMSAIFKHTTW
jgi:hypothetical protein